MPPKQKKQPKNAFYFFMMDWKAEKQEQGQRFSGLKEVAELCAEDWQNLPEYNQRRYKQMEKEAKEKDKSDLSNKYTSLGVTYEQMDKEKREKETAVQMMNREIDNTLTNISANLDSLKSHYFYLAHTNVYCYWGAAKEYIPCEVAISKFNLANGLVATYHVFPAPLTKDGKIPLGYRYEVQRNTDEVHSIPDPTEFDQIEYDWSKIRSDVRNFLTSNNSADLPPLYTMDSDDSKLNCHITAVKNFFDSVADDSNDNFRVYSLSLLFFKLYDVCQKVAVKLFRDHEKAFPVEGVAHQQLLKDVYNFSPGLACAFHETSEHPQNCSLSFARRWVFLISEFCCKALRIDLIPGQHCLTTAKVASVSEPKLQPKLQPRPRVPSPSFSRAGAAAAAAAAGKDDDDSDDGGPWSRVPKVHHGMRNLSLNENATSAPSAAWGPSSGGQQGAWGARVDKHGSSSNGEVLFIDHSKMPDPSQIRVLRTGQSANVVSEVRPQSTPTPPSVRLPTTRGRGELLAQALSQQQASPGASFSSDDFPAIGASKPGRLAKPMTAGWGRGFLKE